MRGTKWSSRVLERNLNTFYFERILSSQNKQNALHNSQQFEKANSGDFIKDPYVFEFLNIPEPTNALEHELESALIQNLQQFCLNWAKASRL